MLEELFTFGKKHFSFDVFSGICVVNQHHNVKSWTYPLCVVNRKLVAWSFVFFDHPFREWPPSWRNITHSFVPGSRGVLHGRAVQTSMPPRTATEETMWNSCEQQLLAVKFFGWSWWSCFWWVLVLFGAFFARFTLSAWKPSSGGCSVFCKKGHKMKAHYGGAWEDVQRGWWVKT